MRSPRACLEIGATSGSLFWARISCSLRYINRRLSVATIELSNICRKACPLQVDNNTNPLPKPRKGKRPHGNSPSFDLRSELYRVTGTDLTQIDGINVVTAQAILADTGTDVSAWKTEKHFVSWLGLYPDHRISGGKVLPASNAKSYQQEQQQRFGLQRARCGEVKVR